MDRVKKNIVAGSEELRYTVELFNKNYNNLEQRSQDMDCFASAELSVIRQPKSVTYSTVNATPLQHQVLVETIRCLQPYMSKSAFEIITLREKFNFMVNIDFSQFKYFKEHVAERESFLESLQSLRFTFGWKQKAFKDENGVEHKAVAYEYSGYIYIGHLRRNDSSIYGIHVNPMALPYLLFIGKDMNFTEFDYNVYLGLNSVFCQRLYIKVCDWAAQGSYRKMSVEELKRFVGSEQSNISQFTRRVLDSTRDQLFRLNSKVIFDYEPVKENVSGFKKTIVGFELFMSTTLSSKYNVTLDAKKSFLEQQFLLIADTEKRTYARHAVQLVLNSAQADSLVFKFRYYLDKLNKREIREAEYKNTMLKILRENFKDEFKKPLDLRSELHIRNSMRSKTKGSMEDGVLVSMSED